MRRRASGIREESGRVDERLASLQHRYSSQIEAELRRVLGGRELIHYSLMRYHLGWEDAQGRPQRRPRGKLLRPLLCSVCCEAAGGKAERAVPVAAALELLHNFSLIHDDIEDGSPRRHGLETVWRVRGIPLALNAGDGMFALAHVALHRLNDIGLPPQQQLAIAQLLDVAALRLCEGQYRDLSYEDRLDVREEDYLEMVAGKTAALMAAAAASGALVGDAPASMVARFEDAGRDLGFAFQIRDDILGIWGMPSETGKPAGEDISARKKSFPVVHALQDAAPRARRRLKELYGKGSLEEGDMEEVLTILEQSGSREHSQRTATSFAERAVAHLEGLNLVRERREDLEALAAYFVSREA